MFDDLKVKSKAHSMADLVAINEAINVLRSNGVEMPEAEDLENSGTELPLSKGECDGDGITAYLSVDDIPKDAKTIEIHFYF